jgi:NAD(P)-dependent dehydrogenase (short-subunit alcohol dehydrogenase family)
LDGLGYRGATCVVTGGASGMGEAVVRILGDLGAKVHVVDIQEPKIACESFVAGEQIVRDPTFIHNLKVFSAEAKAVPLQADCCN